MTKKIIQACVDKWIPSGKEMAIVSEVQWKNGQTIRVRFLNGDPQIQKKVQDIAKEWEKYANLKLDFGSDKDAEIRISLKRLNEEGRPDTSSWSVIGTMAVSLTQEGKIPKDSPTMNYGWLEPDTPNEEYRRVVLHEFGHALGCIHEHQSPASGVIPWDKPKVYEYYKMTQGWDPEEVDQQGTWKIQQNNNEFYRLGPNIHNGISH